MGIPVSVGAYEKTSNDAYRRNRLLLHWLSHDTSRAELFALINRHFGGKLLFPSRDSAPRECECVGLDVPRKPAVPGHMNVTLVTNRAGIDEVLGQPERYASRVYAELGGGSFMLALDPTTAKVEDAHAKQRHAFSDSFPRDPSVLRQIAHASCKAAAVMSFRAPTFDLADFAEQAALRYCQMLMGYSLYDYSLLERSLRAAYRGLVHQVYERHFVTDPNVIPNARKALGELLTRTAALIDAYAEVRNGDEDHGELKGCQDPLRPPGFHPVLKMMGLRENSDLNGEQRAIVATGAAIGTVGNVQAAICIAVQALFKDNNLRAKATQLALKPDASVGKGVGEAGFEQSVYDAWMRLLVGPLRANPPIPYLPRLQVDGDGTKRGEMLLALGGGTAHSDLPMDADDPLIWGLPPNARHNCAGRALAWPLLIEAVQRVVALPHIEEGLKPTNARVAGLKKRHGFACESYPFTYRRDKERAQSSLNVAMRIRAPIKDNVDKLREVIRTGAPRIEGVLREARHVHFAWFEIVENDTLLVLHTVYDGPFAAYLQHFALRAGDLFDGLFQFIEDPPPMPVHKYPNEFVAHLQRYDRPPAMGYFFSAYPEGEVARIVRDLGRGP